MAGTFTGKVLAEGQLPNAKTTLYTVPANVVAYVKFLHCENVAATVETIRIYAKPGSTSRGMGRCVLNPGEFARFVDKDETLVLEAGDLIEGSTTNASSVDYIISGVEES